MSAQIISARFKADLSHFSLDAHFGFPASGVTALVGPSGSGKTTLLRCIAGLQRSEGSFALPGTPEGIWQAEGIFRPPHLRPVGYVFQESNLFPHLTVRENLRFGFPKAPGAKLKFEWDRIVEVFRLAPLLDRNPESLSGGEQRRVAIARAILAQPELVLLDEPLTGLDVQAKQEILAFLEEFCRNSSVPVLHATHSIQELERLGTHYLMLIGGKVTRSGSLEPVRPKLAQIRALEREVGLFFE